MSTAVPDHAADPHDRVRWLGVIAAIASISVVGIAIGLGVPLLSVILDETDLYADEQLGRIAREMGFAELMYLGKGVRREGGARLPTSILANLYEALLCALYEEGGLEEARRFVENDLGPVIKSITSHQFQQNYKSALQHLVQSRSERAPMYKVISEVGPDHQKEFHVVVSVDGVTFGPGVGRNKKEAEQRAAKAALTELLKEFDKEDDDDEILEVPVPEDDFDDE